MEDKTVFHEEFLHYLKYAMVVYKREPAVERVIEFAAKFVTSFHQSDEEEEDDEEGGGILDYLFSFLLKVLWQLELWSGNRSKFYYTKRAMVGVCVF